MNATNVEVWHSKLVILVRAMFVWLGMMSGCAGNHAGEIDALLQDSVRAVDVYSKAKSPQEKIIALRMELRDWEKLEETNLATKQPKMVLLALTLTHARLASAYYDAGDEGGALIELALVRREKMRLGEEILGGGIDFSDPNSLPVLSERVKKMDAALAKDLSAQ